MKNKKYPYYEVPTINNMRELVCYCSDMYGEKTAFNYLLKKTEIRKSYKTFFEDIVKLSSYLVKEGYNRTHIALLGENSYEWLVSYFAIVNSNNVVVPLDKEISADDICNIIDRSNSKVLIHSDEYSEEALSAKNVNCINMASFALLSDNEEYSYTQSRAVYDKIEIKDDQVCAIVYTSGTTSEPKGVMLSHSNIISDTVATSKSVRVLDPSLLTLPLHHTYGFVASVTIPMLIGSSIFINSSTRSLLNDIKFSGPEYMAVVPLIAEVMYNKIWKTARDNGKEQMLARLVKISDFLCKIGIDVRRKLFKSVIDGLGGNLKILVIGGASIDPKIVKGFYSFGIKALCGYGITECSPVVSTVRNKHYCPESVGTVHPGVEVRIVKNEIQVKGDTVFLGYYNDPDTTSDVFDGKWFKTGDIGEIKDDFLYITGRIKNLIILSNGKNISPEESEHFLKSNIPEIGEVVVYAKGEKIVAEIFAEEAAHISIGEKITELNKRLPVYKQINNVVYRNTEFEKTTTKKIKRTNIGGNPDA